MAQHTRSHVITWRRHHMETFSVLLAICLGNSPVTGEFPPQRPVTRSFDFFSLICVWKNGWVNNREAGDFRRYRAHHYVIVMHHNSIFKLIRISYDVSFSRRLMCNQCSLLSIGIYTVCDYLFVYFHVWFIGYEVRWPAVYMIDGINTES